MWQEFCLLRRARKSEKNEIAICSEDCPLPEAAACLVTGPRAETGGDRTGRDLCSPPPPLPATGTSFREGRETPYWVVLFRKGSHQPNQSKPVPCSETLMLGPQLPSGGWF